MADTPKPVRQKYTAYQAALLLLFLGWFATAAAGACLPLVHLSAGSSTDAYIHTPASHAGGNGDLGDACCVSSSDARHPPLPVQRDSAAEPKPAALPASETIEQVDAVPTSWRASLSSDATLSRPPFYLLYKRLLVHPFS